MPSIHKSVIPTWIAGIQATGRFRAYHPWPGFGNCSCIALPPASLQSTRFSAGMTIFIYNDMRYAKAPNIFINNSLIGISMANNASIGITAGKTTARIAVLPTGAARMFATAS